MAPTKFDFLLNAFEAASQHAEPATQDYAAKRRAVFAYVRRIERELQRTRALTGDLWDAEQMASAAHDAVASTRRRLGGVSREIAEELADEQAACDRMASSSLPGPR